jgi:4-aminobutyrate aminotransferase/(S)-3-amino-2-methylpropionate transaminase
MNYNRSCSDTVNKYNKESSMPTISISTPLPGPKSQAVLARRDAAVSKASFRSTPVVAASASGAAVTDVDGNTFLDFTAGIGTLNVGHAPAEVVAAIREQAGDLIHLCAIVGSYEPYIALAEKLNELVPIAGPKKTFLSNSGAEAVETAVKMARAYTGRPAIVAYEGAYHGRTLLTLSLTSKYALFKKGFGPFAPEIYRVPYPYAYRCPHCRNEGVCNLTCFEDLERALITQIDPAAVAALIIEPVQGEGGFIPASYEYLRKVRALCDKHGIVLIADEVQAGFCRTGRWFSTEHSGVEPDLVVMAKSLAAGMPLAAVTGKASYRRCAPPRWVGFDLWRQPGGVCGGAQVDRDHGTRQPQPARRTDRRDHAGATSAAGRRSTRSSAMCAGWAR